MPWDTSDSDAKNQRLLHAVLDVRVPMERTAEIVEKAIDTNFATESAAGEKWPELAESTKIDRARHGYPADHPMLERTRTLRDNMKGSHDHHSAEVGPSEDIEYAALQNFGSEDGRVPAREFLNISAPTKTRSRGPIVSTSKRTRADDHSRERRRRRSATSSPTSSPDPSSAPSRSRRRWRARASSSRARLPRSPVVVASA
jgi:phage gpG-like protein